MAKVWKDNACILHSPSRQTHHNSCQHRVATQVDTDSEKNIFPHLAYAVLGFYMPAGTDERTQVCHFSDYTEQKDW